MPMPNRLQYETSPYLLQHAHNPVDWYAWKPEAFERARAEDKPVLVSIGYSTCHWCHVMERESFEDESIAAFMNEHFINIKVDREERPDVDQIYMDACQAIHGSGGWPLNCFLTPEGKPYFAGTYYPPRPAHNRPSWPQVLQRMSAAYREQREVVEEQAGRLLDLAGQADATFFRDQFGPDQPDNGLGEQLTQQIFQRLLEQFDRKDGGFGGAPKFPATMSLQYLLDYGLLAGESQALEAVEFSLEKMIGGGIYDQLGGGFARYATDRAWLIPHFEKMLYDNALLVSLLSAAYQQTGKELFRRAIEETLAFIEREMTHPEGGFYAALDADSEGEEGKFYVWEQPEIEAVLGDEAALFNGFYGVTEKGNWEGKNILWRPHRLEEYAAQMQLAPDVLQERLDAARTKLLARRAGRVRPGLDDKILLSWNALQVIAYARAYVALGRTEYRDRAERNLDFLLRKFRREEGEGFYHTYKDGKAQYPAFLDDYAHLIAALLEVYRIGFREEYLHQAQRLSDLVLDHFLDPTAKMFYFTSSEQADLPLRKKDLYDGAVPAGNSTMAGNLQLLAVLFDRADYRDLAADMLGKVSAAVGKYPGSFGRWASALLREVYPLREIAIVGPEWKERADEVNAWYLPQTLLMAAPEGSTGFPLLEGKGQKRETLIYLCEQYACRQPVKSLAALKQLVGAN